LHTRGSQRLIAVLIVCTALGCRRNQAPPDEDSTKPPPAASPLSTALEIDPAYATATLTNDPDDPAFWVHPTDPSRSLIIGTMKVASPAGAIVVFGMDGQVRQLISGIDRPNNVDVEYRIRLGGRDIDIVVATERLKRQLRAFRVDPAEGRLVDLGAVPVLEGQEGEAGAPMGVALYRRDRDGAIFAIVAPKAGPRDGYLWQYQLSDAGGGRVGARFVRRFGTFSATTVREENEIEAVAVDDALGFVYYADEADGIHKWHADPDHPDAQRELAHFGRSGFRGDREGIALYVLPDGTGYIICTDQLDEDSEYHVFAREGAPGNPHDHSREIAVLRGEADATDGIEISSRDLGPALPHGALIAMNSAARNFLVYRWQDVAATVKPALRLNDSRLPTLGTHPYSLRNLTGAVGSNASRRQPHAHERLATALATGFDSLGGCSPGTCRDSSGRWRSDRPERQ
jgi:3-phytase